MKRPILALLLVSIVLLAAEPAAAVDDRFWGQYRATWSANENGCGGDQSHRVQIRYINGRVRRYDPAGGNAGWRLTYEPGKRLPWQFNGTNEGMALRYIRSTDSAVGVAFGQDCSWDVRLVYIG